MHGLFSISHASKLSCQNTREPANPAFATGLSDFNSQLREFDSIKAKKPEQLTGAERQVLNDPRLIDLSNQRQQFVNQNAQHHTLYSAQKPNSPVYQHLDVHFTGKGEGSVFTPSATFQSPSDVIRFSEDVLGDVYKTGKVPTNLPPGVRSIEIIEGKPPGGRVVIKVTADQPVGKNAVVEIPEGVVPTKTKRTNGGREETVNTIPGKLEDTNEFYIIGGPYGPTGQFGLFTTFPGKYAPPMSDTAFWSRHAFVKPN